MYGIFDCCYAVREGGKYLPAVPLPSATDLKKNLKSSCNLKQYRDYEYCISYKNAGYNMTLSLYCIPDSFLIDVLDYENISDTVYEKSVKHKHFAFCFKTINENNNKAIYHTFTNCICSSPVNDNSTTSEHISLAPFTVEITAFPRPTDNKIHIVSESRFCFD